MKKRIWELDAFRGICIFGMMVVHFAYDLTDLFGIIQWQYPAWFAFMQRWGGVLFLLISGISATLGRSSVRRGFIVLLAGAVVTTVTYCMYKYFSFAKSIIIYFGVLQCLGTCMILWWLFKRLPNWALVMIGLMMVAAGLYLDRVILVDHPWLIPLGFVYPRFASSDYFPLLPNLGFFLLGGVLGRTVYNNKQTLLPMLSERTPIIRGLCFCGKHSLWFYLLHQPILAGICMLLQ